MDKDHVGLEFSQDLPGDLEVVFGALVAVEKRLPGIIVVKVGFWMEQACDTALFPGDSVNTVVAGQDQGYMAPGLQSFVDLFNKLAPSADVTGGVKIGEEKDAHWRMSSTIEIVGDDLSCKPLATFVPMGIGVIV